jgi:hypothetical protein
VDGFSKEMNLHSASPDRVWPHPFHGMKQYPYPIVETPLRSEEYLAYHEEYNTRIVTRSVPMLETVALND